MDGERCINGKPVKINQGQQDKHIVGTNNYNQELNAGKPRSILNGDADQLLNDYAGTGQKINDYKERVDFGKTIGQYCDPTTRTYTDTTIGTITYGKNGAHIIPARPN
ncbi:MULTISPECIES: polymorphic toxin type 50 domain-containing protein [unclassified Clostridium]|uniref:polymorphic toxin type 50 domain-containing protein n=1 Tax=unclassified Clostridium TaxID=2614128 RepID=UPI00207AA1B7